MTVIDRRRLDPEVFDVDPRVRDGRYTDQYFVNVRDILATVAEEGYRFRGKSPLMESRSVDPRGIDVGNIVAEMQCFTKRKPRAIACGIDHAVALLKAGAGYHDEGGEFVSTWNDLDVVAVHDGAKLDPWVPGLKIRGRYRDFAILETVILGVMTYATKIATQAYELLQAAGGKYVFFFPARFDLPRSQAVHGYAYKVAVDVFNADTGADHPVMITSEAQGSWFGGEGGGTTSHSFVLSFLRDCAESMVHFARLMPPETPRIALVDTAGDCVRDAVRTALRLFSEYWDLKQAGESDEAEKYRLFGVRLDTGSEVRDASIEPLGLDTLDMGVVPRLATNVRKALDDLHNHPEVHINARDEAKRFFRDVKIVVSGGFDQESIRRFERLGVPADVYGVGSAFLKGASCDYTADLVQLRVDGTWYPFAKAGRRPVENPDLEPVS